MIQLIRIVKYYSRGAPYYVVHKLIKYVRAKFIKMVDIIFPNLLYPFSVLLTTTLGDVLVPGGIVIGSTLLSTYTKFDIPFYDS